MKSSPELPKTQAAPLAQGHSFEARVRHDLMARPELAFSSLVVHRIPDGICVEGVVTSTTEGVDVNQMVREVAGVNSVLNHLVMCPLSALQPRKG